MKRHAIALALVAATTSALAQTYPSAPIRIITPFAAGSGADIVARLIAQGMGTELGQSVIVDNKPGAGGNLGVGMGAKAAPDGYTLTLGTSGPLTVNQTLYGNLPFDPNKDFAPISLVAMGPMVVVTSTTSRFKTLADLLAAAKVSPQALNYGTPGVGSAPHLAAALLLSASSVEMTHIPYKGNGEALSELLGERLDAVFSGLPSVVPLAKAGKLRPLAVTGTKRSAMLPDVPSVVEAGFPAAQAQVWYGLMAPAQTPGEIVVRLHTAIEKAVNQPGMKEKFIELGLEPAIDSPEEFRTLIKEDSQRLGKVIRSVGMKAE